MRDPQRMKDDSRSVDRGSIIALLAVLTFGAILLRGYFFGTSDHNEQLPLIRRAVNPDHLLKDWFVNKATEAGNVRSGYVALMSPIVKILGEELGFWAMYVLAAVLMASALYILAQAIGMRRKASLMAGWFGLFSHFGTLGDSQVSIPILVPSFIAHGLIILAAAATIRRQTMLVWATMSVCIWVHPLLGLEATILLAGLQFLAVDRLRLTRDLWPAPAALLLGLVLHLPLVLSQFNVSDIDQHLVLALLAAKRHPWHYLASTWPIEDWLGFLAPVILLGLLLWDKKSGWKPMAAGGLGLAALIMVAYLGTDAFESVWVAKLQLYRLTVVVPMVLALVAGRAADSWLDRDIGSSLFGIGLLAGYAAANLLRTPLLFLLLGLAIFAPRLAARQVWNYSKPHMEHLAGLVLVVVVASLSLLALDMRPWLAAGLAIGVVRLERLLTVVGGGPRARWRSMALLAPGFLLLVCGWLAHGTQVEERGWVRFSGDHVGQLRYVQPLDEMARWVRGNTPQHAVFLTPPHYPGFRLLSERAIVVDFHAFVFEDQAMLLWWNRITAVAGQSELELGYGYRSELEAAYAARSYTALASTAERFDADYLVAQLETTSDAPGSPIHIAGQYGLFAVASEP